MLARKDLVNTLIVGSLVSLFAVPILINTEAYANFPFPPLIFHLAVPVLGLIGMVVASLLGKRLPVLWQFSKFMAVGFSNTAIDFGILNGLIYFTDITSGLQIIPLNAISFTVAIVNSYFWNRKWVFENPKESNFFTFVGVTLIGLAINSTLVFLITTFIPPVVVTSPKLWANIAKAFATGISLVWNFMGYKLVVFKK